MNLLKLINKLEEEDLKQEGSHLAQDMLGRMLDLVPADMRESVLRPAYEAVYGQHLSEEVAKDLVNQMWHKDRDGNSVVGELVNLQTAMSSLQSSEEMAWDAYAAANAFMHDLLNTGLTQQQILKAAKAFWFDDSDYDGSKVYDYFKHKIFK